MTTDKEVQLIDKARPRYGTLIIKFMGDKISSIKTEIDADKEEIAKVYK